MSATTYAARLRDQLKARFVTDEAALIVTDWAANTFYKAGRLVLSPLGQYKPGVKTLVQANADFTSGVSFNAANWTALNPGLVAAAGYQEPTNTTGSTTFLTLPTIPASQLVAHGTVIRIDIDTYMDMVLNKGAFNHQIKVNGTQILGLVMGAQQTTASGTKLHAHASGRLMVDVTGSGGSVSYGGTRAQIAAAGTTSGGNADSSGATGGSNATGGVPVDLSTGLALTITGTMGAADPGNVFRSRVVAEQIA